ncbi:E3 ubiquitin-protein ligase XIAP-like [Ruditapes philippinarum]|uniref:E3 ubiquitin-protein ligase XIAP-like n=1 Tax=Ruditapes philippinarum TaxID=129788 RepID=UPI00295B5497|nr:E3 ubiquitin-protein ligase XIAP-like [Ruditapes philippinarum]
MSLPAPALMSSQMNIRQDIFQELVKNELFRVSTFRTFPKDNKPYIIRLAQAGFYSTCNGDEVECHSCLLRIYNWSSDDDPMEIHLSSSPSCQFLRRSLGSHQRCINQTQSDNSLQLRNGNQNNIIPGQNLNPGLEPQNQGNSNSIEYAAALYAENQRIIDRHYCINCKEQLRSVVFISCQYPHLLACNVCAMHYDRCPVCNTIIKALLYLPR